MNKNNTIGIFVTNSSDIDPTLGGVAAFVVRPANDQIKFEFPYYNMEASETFVADLDVKLTGEGSPKNFLIAILDVGFTGDFLNGVGEVVKKHNSIAFVHGVKDEFSATHPNKLFLKRMLDDAPDRIVASAFCATYDSFMDIASKPIIARAFDNQGFTMATVYISDTDSAITLIEQVNMALVWNQKCIEEATFISRLKTLGVKFDTSMEYPIEYTSVNAMQVLTGPGPQHAVVRNASVPPNFHFLVWAIVEEEGKLYGKLKQGMERWVMLQDENGRYAS